MKKGGARKGAGRPPINPDLKKVQVGLKLPRWLLAWLRGHDRPAAQLIEEALREVHQINPPVSEKQQTWN